MKHAKTNYKPKKYIYSTAFNKKKTEKELINE